ncbi:MAG: ATP-grasp domain-containing protein [Bacteroidales bacterium]
MIKKKKIFVIGLDDFNLEKLSHLPESEECEFLPAIKLDEMREVKKFSVPGLLETAHKRINKAGRIDAVVTWFDFPGSVLVPIIAEEYDLPGPSLKNVMKCEHKYWSRIEQSKAIPENIPKFKVFDIYDDNAFDKIGFETPFWIKPIKSYGSFLAYRIGDKKQFNECMAEALEHIDLMVEPFTDIFHKYNVSPEISEMKEKMFAETVIKGHQCTAEGYAINNEVEVYGIVDSILEGKTSSFSRYEYPSALKNEVQERIAGLSKKVIKQIGLNNSAFNIEYFYNEKTDEINLLEINPRISQSHADMFEKVHGISHHRIMLRLALNRQPEEPEKQGDFKKAAHFMLRSFKPGTVKNSPSDKIINDLKQKYPGFEILLNVKEGMDLNDLAEHHIDSYSYVMANIFLGAQNRKELLEKYNDVVEQLSIEIESEE